MGDNISISEFSELLQLRAAERFEEKHIAPRLQATLIELSKIAKQSESKESKLSFNPLLSRLLKGLILIATAWIVYHFNEQISAVFKTDNNAQLIQIIESASNLILIAAAALLSILSLDNKLRRSKVRSRCAAIRSIINTLALLQLEKDPSRLKRSSTQNTAHSPKLNFTALELDCYFEYSIEALEICSAILSSYAKILDDSILLEEISDLQELTAAKQEMISSRRERLQLLLSIDA